MEGEILQIIKEMTVYWSKNCQITKRGGWNKRGGWKIFMKSINVEGGFYFVEGEIFQIIREMTGSQDGGRLKWILINVEAGINVEVGKYL